MNEYSESDRKAALCNLAARVVELASEYATQSFMFAQGRTSEWQRQIDERWKNLIEAENDVKRVHSESPRS